MKLRDELELAIVDIDPDLDALLARAVTQGRRLRRRRRLALGGGLAAVVAAGAVVAAAVLPEGMPPAGPAGAPSTTASGPMLDPGEPGLPTRALLVRLQAVGPVEDFAGPAASLGAEIRSRAKDGQAALTLVGQVTSVRSVGPAANAQWVIAIRTTSAVTTRGAAPRAGELVEIYTRAPQRPTVDPATVPALLQDVWVLARSGSSPPRWYADYGGLLFGTVRGGRLWLEPASGWLAAGDGQIGPEYLGELTTPEALLGVAERAARVARG